MSPKTITMVGVGVSVGLVILVGVALLAVNARHDSIGEPTDETAAPVLKKIDMNLDIGKLVALPPEGGASAQAVYVAAVKEAVAIDAFPDLVTRTAEPEKLPTLKSIIDKIEDAADKPLGAADLDFDDALPMSPSAEWRTRDQLYAIGKLMAKAATSMRSDHNREGSEKALRAGLVYGQRMYNNGVYVAYKSAALGIVSEALASYEREYSPDFFSDPAKLDAVKEIKAAYLRSSDAWTPKEKLVRRLSPLTAPGDLWNMAEHDGDRAWRLDGIMWLGVAKFTEAGEGSAQRAAIQKYLEQKAGSSDPYIARRAKAAADFSKMDIRTFRVD